MGSMQCNVEFGYQLSICSRTEENHGKPWSSWPVAGPSECNWLLANSPAWNLRTLTLVPTLCYCIFLFFSLSLLSQQVILFLQLFVCAYDLDKQQTVQNSYERNKGWTNTHRNIHISVPDCSLEIRCFTRFVAYPITKTVSQLSHFTGLHFSFVSLVLSSFHYKKENTSHFTSLLVCQLLPWNNKHTHIHTSNFFTRHHSVAIVRLEQLDTLKKSSDLIRIWTSYLSACSIVLQPYMLWKEGI
jgi:hypothetical protein